jgi:hypothetical protein
MKKKKYWNMTAAELAEVTDHFNRSFVADKSRPLTTGERKQWQRIKRKKGRPRIGKGFQRISVSLERSLLARITALARKRRMPRSKLLAQAIEAVLSTDDAPN